MKDVTSVDLLLYGGDASCMRGFISRIETPQMIPYRSWNSNKHLILRYAPTFALLVVEPVDATFSQFTKT